MKEGAASPPIAVAAAVGQDAALAGGIALEQQRSTKSKRAARVFDLIVGVSLAAAAGHSIAAETNTLLESTTFLLLSLTGVVLFLAACGLSSIRSRAEFLDHKVGRAGLSFVAALLCAAAAPQRQAAAAGARGPAGLPGRAGRAAGGMECRTPRPGLGGSRSGQLQALRRWSGAQVPVESGSGPPPRHNRRRVDFL